MRSWKRELPDQTRDASMGSDKPRFCSESNGKPHKEFKPDRSHVQMYVLKWTILANIWRLPVACGQRIHLHVETE